MLVCHCHGVNDRTIRRCVNDGARSENDVREACGAGGSCGSCRPVIDRLIELHHDAQGAIQGTGTQG
jgi:bacterioferritin-associated ferredoxin